MRIISGTLKGKKMLEFKHETTRPTLDNVKEALFDILFDKVKGDFLDLFGGTGSIGFEAYSRGANSVCIVELNESAFKNIIQNAKKFGIDDKISLYKSDYISALKKFEKNGLSFDCIYIDPPYNSTFAEKAIEMIIEKNLLKTDGIIVWEHDNTKLSYENKENVKMVMQKKYGRTYLSFFVKI